MQDQQIRENEDKSFLDGDAESDEKHWVVEGVNEIISGAAEILKETIIREENSEETVLEQDADSNVMQWVMEDINERINSFGSHLESFDVNSPLASLNASTVSKELLTCAALLLLVTVYGIRLMLNRKKTRPRAPSHDIYLSRTRSASFDFTFNRRDRLNTEDGPSSLLLSELGDNPAAQSVLGPTVSSLVFETWTPPLEWTEASHKLLPQNTSPKLQRTLILDVQEGRLIIQGVGNKRDIPIADMSLHVKPPLEGAVLELYVKDSPKEDWMENTFASAYEAAQFQHDLLAYQVAGESIHNMYQALEIIQKGSISHDGKESVLHHSESDLRGKKGAVAWDDAMRCFSTISSVRGALEYHLTHRLIRDDTKEGSGSDSPALLEEYVNKRALLGQVDFFRLFVGCLPPTSLPQNDSNPERMDQFLRLRKQVAQAAVLVRAYVRARTVVNQGWHLSVEVPQEGYLTRRLAFDDHLDNMPRDVSSKNEYYEATVSRDIRCEVHSAQHLKKHGASTMSQYQAYSLVGCHVFKLPPKGTYHPLLHTNDPVQALPSLRKMIETHPDLDFFVSGFFPEGPRVAIVHVYVRSLPKGVDTQFDTIFDRFVNGSAQVRDRKLEVFMQLGPGAGLSPLAWAALKAFSLMLSWTRKGEAEIPLESGADRTPFPGMTLSNYTQTAHFGGCLQTDTSLPMNYVAVTSYVDGTQMRNMAARVLYQRLEDGALASSIVDFTFVLEGQNEDELPERALSSIRMVHINPTKVALPTYFSSEQQPQEEETRPLVDIPQLQSVASVANVPTEFETVYNAVDGFIGAFNAWNPLGRNKEAAVVTEENGSGPVGETGIHEGEANIPEIEDEDDNADPFRAGVAALTEILDGVTVPMRRDNVTESDITTPIVTTMQPQTKALPSSVKREDLVNVNVLGRMSKSDLRRYFVAAECDLKEAAVRIVESAAWRGVTFPIDTRECRVELQSGQFFQQGRDFHGNPVFYFQNMCLGPWRKDVDATVLAVLHRLETCLQALSKETPNVKCTVIVLLGTPLENMKKSKKKKEGKKSASADETEKKDEVEGEADDAAPLNPKDKSAWNPFRMGANPRVSSGEEYFAHSNTTLIQRFVDELSKHYPERLHKVLLVPGKGGSGLWTAALGGSLGVRTYISSTRTRAKVLHLNKATDLTNYVSKSELATIVGGTSLVDPSAFEV